MMKKNICDICGAPNALLRTITNPELGIIDELSGFTCQECIDADKEYDYLKSLVNELDSDDELRDQLIARFETVRLEQKGFFISNYGLGIKGKRCEVCENEISYLCIVEDHYPDGRVEMLDEISMWCCVDCISTGRQKTRMENEFRELMSFRIECDDVKTKLDKFMEILNPTRKQRNEFMELVERLQELIEEENIYDAKSKVMKKERLVYKNVPIKTIIKTVEAGERCFCCGEIHSENHQCEK